MAPNSNHYSKDHPAPETLEMYLMDRLPGQIGGDPDDETVRNIEEHALLCETCLDFMEQHDRMHALLTAADAKPDMAGRPG